MIDQKRVFQIFNELDALNYKIQSEFPEYEFIDRLEYLERLLGDTYAALKVEFEPNLVPNKEVLTRTFKVLQRDILMFFLIIQMIDDHLKISGEFKLSDACFDHIRSHRQAWSDIPAMKMAHQIRNFLAHIRPFMGDSLNYSKDLHTGEFKVSYSLSEQDWVRLLKYVETKTRAEWPMVKSYIESNLRYEIFNPDKNANEFRHSFAPIIGDVYNPTTAFIKSAGEAFAVHYQQVIKTRNSLIDQVDKLNQELDSMGLITPGL